MDAVRSRLVRSRWWRGIRTLRSALGSRAFSVELALWLTPRGRAQRVTPDTDLVIEGFPRSSNSFARVAFRRSQPGPVTTSDHTHLVGQVLKAVRLGVPVLVVVRPPVDAVTSLLVAGDHLSPRGALDEYVRFHRHLLPVVDRVVIATFDEVTTDFGAVIEKVNARFGVAFSPFEHSPDEVSAVFRDMDRWEERKGGADDEVGRRVPHPTARRSTQKLEVSRRLRAPDLAALLTEATDLYTRVVIQRSQAPGDS